MMIFQERFIIQAMPQTPLYLQEESILSLTLRLLLSIQRLFSKNEIYVILCNMKLKKKYRTHN